MVHAAQLRRAYYGPCIDQLKCGLFLHSVRWHGRPLGEAWLPVERKARQPPGAYIDEARASGEVNAAGRACSSPSPAPGRRCCAAIPTPSGAGFGTSSVSSVSFSDVRSATRAGRRPERNDVTFGDSE
jgi:hypothetical protein